MNGNNQDQALDNGVLMELLRRGLIVGSITAAGNFVLGGMSGIISAALGVLLSYINRESIESARERINALSNNIIVRTMINLLPPLYQLPWERIWRGLVRVANFLSSRVTGSGPRLMITNH